MDPPLEMRNGLLNLQRHLASASEGTVEVVDVSRPWNAHAAAGCGSVNGAGEQRGRHCECGGESVCGSRKCCKPIGEKVTVRGEKSPCRCPSSALPQQGVQCGSRGNLPRSSAEGWRRGDVSVLVQVVLCPLLDRHFVVYWTRRMKKNFSK